jgi:hypothetical protein
MIIEQAFIALPELLLASFEKLLSGMALATGW